jgi:WD40 repeat protein
MDSETLIQNADRAVYAATGVHLQDLQIIVLRGTLHQQDYKTIARETGKNLEYIRKIGSRLWQQLSHAIGEPITKINCREALHRATSISLTSPIVSNPRQDWGEAPDVPVFFGREAEIETLRSWIVDDRCRFISIVGMGGIGKTAVSLKLGKGGIGKTDLSIKVAQGIQDQFEFVIWRSLLNAPLMHEVLRDWLEKLSQYQSITHKNKPTISHLLEILKQHRCLLILDNAESILETGMQQSRCKPGYENYDELLTKLASVPHQSCILLTSREKIHSIDRFSGKVKPVRVLKLGGLNEFEGRDIFSAISDFSATEQQWQQIITFYNGNPLALELAAHHIEDEFAGDIKSFWTAGKPIFSDLEELLDWHFDRLSEPEQEVLYWLTIFREPASLEEIKAELVSPIAQAALPTTIKELQQKISIEVSDRGLRIKLQPVLLEYMTERLINEIVQEIKSSNLYLLDRHALVQAQSKDYIKEIQIRLILNPIKTKLITEFQGQNLLEEHLKSILTTLRTHSPRKPGYSGGNLFNLFTQLKTDLSYFDFSKLTLWQADLRNQYLHQVDFSDADFSRAVLTQSFGGIHSLAYSPDGNYLAIGDSHGHIRLHHHLETHPIAILQKHPWWTVSLAFSPNGQYLASSSLHPTVKIWDLATHTCIQDLQGHSQGCWSIAFSPDGQMLATASDDKTLKLWNITTGEIIQTLTGHEHWVLCVAFHPDRPLLASGSSDHTIKLWDLTTGECLTTLTEHSDAVWSIAFSPDGKTIASCGCDKTVKLWNLETWNLKTWNLKTLTCAKTLTGHPKEIKALAFAPDGKTLATVCFGPTVRFWDLETLQCKAIGHGHVTGIRAVAFSADNQTVVTGDNDQLLKVWDARNGKCLRTFHGYTNWIWSIAYSADGKTIAVSYLDHCVRIWDLETEICLQVLKGHTAWIWSVAFSPDGKLVASSGDDETIRLWDVATGELIRCLNYQSELYQGGVWSVSFCPKGEWLVSSGQDPRLKIWQVKTGECLQILEGHQAWVWNVQFSRDRQFIASSSDDMTVKIWEIATGRCIQSLEGHENKVRSIAFSPQGNQLMSGSDDGLIKCWDWQTGACLQTLAGHRGWVWSAQWSADEETVVSCSQDQSIKIWNLNTGECLQTFEDESEKVARSIAVNPRLNIVVSVHFDGTMRMWDITAGSHIKTLRTLRPYENAIMSRAIGLTPGQQETLKCLGAIVGLNIISNN